MRRARRPKWKRGQPARLDGKGFAAKANRRSHAETSSRASKAILNDQSHSKSAQAQGSEIL